MKRIFIVLSCAFMSLWASSQSIDALVAETNDYIKIRDYKNAIMKLKEAQVVIEDIYMSEMKIDLLPSSIEGFRVNEKGPEKIPSFISENRIQLNQNYIGTGGSSYAGGSASLSITVSNIPEKTFEVLNVYSVNNTRVSSDAETYRAFKYHDYRAILSYDKDLRVGKFAAVIGGAVLEINAEGITNWKILLRIAEKISRDKIIKHFGK